MLFPLFGPEAINFRLSKSEVKAIVTTKGMKSLVDTELATKLCLEIIYAVDLLEELRNYSASHEWITDVNMAKDTITALHRVWSINPAVQYGTTEAGPIALDFMAFDNWIIKPGSLGKPVIGGVRVATLDEKENKSFPGNTRPGSALEK